MGYWLRWFCLAIILSLLSNISVSSGVHEAVECAVKIDDPSTFHGTDLTLAGIRKVGELSGGVIIMNSDIAFTEQDFDTQREDIALFIKNETAVHAFYRLRGELYAKTFELVSDSEGKVWVEGQIHLLNSARRSYPKNIVARGGDDYYLYDDGECTALTKSADKSCPCAAGGKNARCVYDPFVSSTVIVSPSTYNRIACNEFSEVDGIFQVIVNKKGPVMCKDSTLQFVQLYDRKWTNRKRVCEAVKIPEVTATTATTPMHITEGSSASSSTVVEFSTSPSISVGMSTSTSVSTPMSTSLPVFSPTTTSLASSAKTPTLPSTTSGSSFPMPFSVETIPSEIVPAETSTVDTSSFSTASTDALSTQDFSSASMETSATISVSTDPSASSSEEDAPTKSALSTEDKGSTVIFGSILGVGIFVALFSAAILALVLTGRLFAGENAATAKNDAAAQSDDDASS